MLRSLLTRQRSLLKEQTGFSAIEILVALAIVGIMGRMVAPSMVRTVEIYRLRGSTLSLYSALQRARTAAAAQNNQYVVTVSGSTYTIIDDDDNSGGQTGAETITAKNLGLEAQGVTLGLAGGPLIFRPNGMTTIPIGSTATITITNASGVAKQVRIQPSGHIRVL